MLELTREKYIDEIFTQLEKSPTMVPRVIELVGSYYQYFMSNWIPPAEFSEMVKLVEGVILDGVPHEIIRDLRGCARLVGVLNADGFRPGIPPFEPGIFTLTCRIKLKNGKTTFAQRRPHDTGHGEIFRWESLDFSTVFDDKKVVGWRETSRGESI